MTEESKEKFDFHCMRFEVLSKEKKGPKNHREYFDNVLGQLVVGLRLFFESHQKLTYPPICSYICDEKLEYDKRLHTIEEIIYFFSSQSKREGYFEQHWDDAKEAAFKTELRRVHQPRYICEHVERDPLFEGDMQAREEQRKADLDGWVLEPLSRVTEGHLRDPE